MPIDLSAFGLAEMLRCSSGVREAGRNAGCLEQAARRICRYLYDELRTNDGHRACALVRCYKTHALGDLEGDLRSVAAAILPSVAPPDPEVKFLILLASAGDEVSWNDRRLSANHRAIPLASASIVEQAPMIAQLVRAFGLDISDVVAPSRQARTALAGKTYGIFFVEDAAQSPYIPAKDFVSRYGIRSVIGFGGALQGGDLFAIVLFTRVAVSHAAADRFRNIALDVKSLFFPFDPDETFDRALITA